MGHSTFECGLQYGSDLFREKHYGQRPCTPHKQAGHISRTDQCCSNVKKALANQAPSTHDP